MYHMPTFSFSRASLAKLEECHPVLQLLFTEALKSSPADFTILCGHRGEAAQERAFAEGRSKAHYGESKHNSVPSMAVDACPYPIDWNDTARFHALVLHIKSVWLDIPDDDKQGWSLSCGADWRRFVDMPHFELRR